MLRKHCIPAALFLLLVAMAVASPARAEMCSAVCSTQVLCSTDCEVCARGADNQDGSCTNGTRWTTCSAAGFPCTTCFPNWQDTGRTLRGVFEKNWVFYCEQFGVYDVFQTDLNHCQANRMVCDEVLVGRGYGVGVSCCAGGMCWGKQSC
jgi:hypothetical protein